ncbi:MAG: NUDIX hydrolase [Lentisphaerae bacterium]|nr:NUDIX hydrolase [Lentisphaerota bacterium]
MNEKTLAARRVFDGRLLKVEVLDVELSGGARGTRDIVRHPGAAAALVELGDGSFVLVRQYRKAVEEALLEIVAGTLEPGEDPEACAEREVREETGYAVTDMRRLGDVFLAPGYSSERIHLFHAVASGARGAARQEDDERVEPVVLRRDELQSMMADGRIRDAKTLAAWLLYVTRGAV